MANITTGESWIQLFDDARTYKVTEAAKILGLHENTLYRLVRSGKLQAFRSGRGGAWLIPGSALNELQVPAEGRKEGRPRTKGARSMAKLIEMIETLDERQAEQLERLLLAAIEHKEGHRSAADLAEVVTDQAPEDARAFAEIFQEAHRSQN